MKFILLLITTAICSLTWSQTGPAVDQPAPFSNVVAVTVTSTGAVLFNMDNKEVRQYVLADIMHWHKLTLKPDQIEKFYSAGTFGCSFAELPDYLDLSLEKRKAFSNQKNFKGIPSVDNADEINDWMAFSIRLAFGVSKKAYDENKLRNQGKAAAFFMPKFVLHAEKGAPLTKLKLIEEIFRNHNLERSGSDALPAVLHVPMDFWFIQRVPEGTDDYGQNDVAPQPPEPVHAAPPSEPYTIVDEQAGFPGGKAGMDQFLALNLEYPDVATDKGIEGKCYIKFVVDRDGSISHPDVVKKVPDCPECDAEALRVIRKMPKWNPAKLNGKIVDSYVILPISFVLP